MRGDGEDYPAENPEKAEAAPSCGFKVVADTGIRPWHHGSCPCGREDAGIDRERTATFTLHFPDKLSTGSQ